MIRPKLTTDEKFVWIGIFVLLATIVGWAYGISR